MKPAVSLLCIGLLYAAAPALGGRPFGRRQPEAAVPSKPSLGEQTRPFHARPAAECLSALGANPRTGLDAAAVEAARAEHGPNELAAAKATPLWRLFLAQFDDSLVKILLVTAAVSMSLALIEREEHGWVEPVVILSILALNAVVGVWQQRSAQGAVEALKRLTPVRARCLRDGMWVDDLPAKDLVPGDVVECRTGDRVPADCRVLELRTTTMRTDEASLTGESSTVDKSAQPAPADAALSQRGCILHASTMVASGAALALVLRTGMRTEIGQIQRGVEEAGQEEADTPLARKLDAFGRQLTWMIGGICVAVYALSIPRFASEAHGGVAWRGALHHFKRSVALGVAAIPEGLPAVITLCLSLGTRRMAQRRAIVRKLPSVETLGCTTVICTDKTGTLTTGQMTVVRLVRPSASKDGTPLLFHEVSGRSYATTDGSVEGLSTGDAACRGVRELAECAALSNDADLQDAAAKAAAAAGGGAAGAAAAAAAAAAAESEPVCATGEPTEAALLTLVGKLGRQMLGGRLVDPADSGAAAIPSDPRAELRKLATLEFTRARKSKSALVREVGSRGASARLLVKGAPDSVLSRCSYIRLPDGGSAKLDAAAREAITAAYSAMGKSALRCIAMASKPARALGALASHDGSPTHRAARSLQDPSKFGEVESGLTFLGLVGIRDPPRPSVGGAIAACRAAGIRVIMITGDSKETAQAVAKDVGIFAPGDPLEAWTFTGKSFFNLPEGQQAALLRSGNLVFCRAEPADKQRLVRMLNKLGEVTAMTGDGVNDAPALRQAAIGIAMGIAGTEVSKEAADIVLADDNFATIVSAVEEGRSIYANMKAFIHYLITCNIGEVVAILISSLLGLPDILSPLQLLWVNLVTDGPPATALGFNPAEKGLMTQKPRGYDESLLPPFTMFRLGLTGLYIGCACVGAFAHTYLREHDIGFLELLDWANCKQWVAQDAAAAPSAAAAAAAKTAAGAVAGAASAAAKTAGKAAVDALDACSLFGEHSDARAKASSMALSVLVVVECVRAFCALSEKQSLLSVRPWSNPYLGIGMLAQVLLHCMIVYTPQLSAIFNLRPLRIDDWYVVLAWSLPVVLLDEMLKFVARRRSPPALAQAAYPPRA